MNSPQEQPPQHREARARRRLFSWIWIVPLLAIGIVIWLAVNALIDRGPLITIVFSDAEGIEAGDTKIRHKDVDLGTVESIHLNDDMSRVLVRARMRRSVEPHLNSGTRFWIVRPRVGVGGISGLSTLVSGSYIEMYPGKQSADGKPERTFEGLDDPPVLTPDTPGRSFELRTDDLGSLVAGSPVSYRGVPVGEIEGYELDPGGKQIKVFAFIRAPYDRYVNAQTRFWNSGGIDLAVGVQGLRFRASSWQQLISGGVSFDTPDESLGAAETAPDTQFSLYSNQYDAQRDPRVQTLVYRVVLPGGGGGVGPGTEVQLEGAGVGEVKSSHLQFDDAREALVTRVEFEIDPSRVEIVRDGSGEHSADKSADASAAAALGRRLEKMVARGLRAHLVAANFLTGAKVLSLDLIPGARPGRIRYDNGVGELPVGSTTDLSDLLASAQGLLHHLDGVVNRPELGHAIKAFDATLTHLDQMSSELQPQLAPLVAELRKAAQAAEQTLQSADGILGSNAANGADVSRLIRELTDSARSLRDLADYLERHPESLIRGRRPDREEEKP